jgi:ubiquinone/menaquinone biosynthesis C-methylase UbiE
MAPGADARFDGLAERYARHRPGYPEAALDAMVRACGALEATAPFLLDVGAGTGISTRALAERLGADWRFVGVEPSDDMRRTAVAQSAAFRNLSFQSGAAEALPFDDGEVGAILVAQALHWFDRPVFYDEARRLLAPGGVLMVLFNDRDPSARLFQEFEDLMEREVTGYSRDYRSFDYAGELEALGWTAEVAFDKFGWNWRVSYADFAGLMLSRSMAKPWVERAGETEVARALEAFIAGHGDGERVDLPYVTHLAIARKAG